MIGLKERKIEIINNHSKIGRNEGERKKTTFGKMRSPVEAMARTMDEAKRIGDGTLMGYGAAGSSGVTTARSTVSDEVTFCSPSSGVEYN